MTDWLAEVQRIIDGNLAADPHFYDDPNAAIREAVAQAQAAGGGYLFQPSYSASSNTRFAVFDGGYTGSGFYGPDNDTYQEWVRKGRP